MFVYKLILLFESKIISNLGQAQSIMFLIHTFGFIHRIVLDGTYYNYKNVIFNINQGK